jgi:DNA-binding MarR family transcriptional regulator
MTDGLEHELLTFVAANELVTANQAAALLEITGSSATNALEQLSAQRLVSRQKMSSSLPATYRITPDGRELIDPALPPLCSLSWPRYRHELAIGWLWLAAHGGSLGEFREALSRRQMQAADATQRTQSLLTEPGAVFSDRSATGPAPHARLAYPDLALLLPDGGWTAYTIVLSPPEPQRLRNMVDRLNHEPLMRAQLYLVEQDRQIDEAIKATAHELGVGDRVHLQLLATDGIAGA